ncbi:MAG TPA: hypothetical protein VHD60_00470 [Candidatus Saccharimonadales bacterium]|nr:hypothetical protein [Candidatus Saccharimonadales bacterium]
MTVDDSGDFLRRAAQNNEDMATAMLEDAALVELHDKTSDIQNRYESELASLSGECWKKFLSGITAEPFTIGKIGDYGDTGISQWVVTTIQSEPAIVQKTLSGSGIERDRSKSADKVRAYLEGQRGMFATHRKQKVVEYFLDHSTRASIKVYHRLPARTGAYGEIETHQGNYLTFVLSHYLEKPSLDPVFARKAVSEALVKIVEDRIRAEEREAAKHAKSQKQKLWHLDKVMEQAGWGAEEQLLLQVGLDELFQGWEYDNRVNRVQAHPFEEASKLDENVRQEALRVVGQKLDDKIREVNLFSQAYEMTEGATPENFSSL